MKFGKKIVALCLGATVAFGSVFGIVACSGNNNVGNTDDPNIRLIYDMYVENCAARSEEALTYEDWLASIRGEDGKDGKDGENGKDGKDGKDGENGKDGKDGENGKDGVTPHIDEQSGHWFIGETDTGISATGAKGSDGDKGSDGVDGKDGNGWLYGDQQPADTLGKDGDLYLNYTDWKVYTKDGGHWTERGSIKGEKGDKGDPATGSATESENAVRTWSNITINASGTYELDVTGVAEGHYWLVAKTETVAAANVLTETYTIGTATYPYDMYSSLTKSFKGFAYISSTATSITLTNKSAANISGDFSLVEYTPVAITTGQEVEIPVPLNGNIAEGNIVSYTFDLSLVGKAVKMSFSYFIVNGVPKSRYIKNTEVPGSINPNWKEANDKVDGLWSGTRTIPEDALRLAFTVTGSEAGCNAVVKIELAS